MKLGIVFEGGGMRGVYTAGIIEAFLEQQFYANYVIGVSAGASNGVSYVSKQRGRALRCIIEYANNPRYASLKSWITTGSYFGMDFLFGDLPHSLEPFDWEACNNNPCEFKIGATDAETGEPVFFDKSDLDDNFTVIRSSCSLPLFSPAIQWKGRAYYDGGVVRPIPANQALADGCDFLVIVLTQPRGFQKEPQKGMGLFKAVLHKYPHLVEAMQNRHLVYNEELERVAELEKEGRALVIAPDSGLIMGRTEKDKTNLKAAGRQGYLDGLDALKTLRAQSLIS